MPTIFRHALEKDLGTTLTDVVTIGGGVRATVIGCNLTNITDYDTAIVDVFVENVFYTKGVVIPPNTTVKIVTQGEKLILPENTTLSMVSDTPDSIDVTVSYVEIS
jgi:hypothetical protein